MALQLRRAWRFIRAFFTARPAFLRVADGRSFFPPIAGGAPEGDDPDPKKDDDPEKDPEKKGDDPKKDDDPEGGDDPDPEDDPDKVKPEDDWKAKARKHERAAKREKKAREDAERKLAARADADKSEQEKAVDAARQEGEKKAKEAANKERRRDRLEVAVTRIASRGVEIGEGDEAKTLRFDDPEDALVFIERQLANGDLDEDEIYDEDGKVNTEAVTDALADLLKSKPKLAADAEGQRPSGDADTRKGSPATKDLEAMSVEDHEKRKHAAPSK